MFTKWKTYTAGAILMLTAIGNVLGNLADHQPIDWTPAVEMFSAGLGMIGVRHALDKAVTKIAGDVTVTK